MCIFTSAPRLNQKHLDAVGDGMHNVMSKRGTDVAKTRAEDKKKNMKVEKEPLWDKLPFNDSGLHSIQQDQSVFTQRNPINGLKLGKQGFWIFPIYDVHVK